MLLSRELGSYVFLGEIITNVPFVPDSPTTDHCGSCTKCLDACPTDAFPEPYVLDATKCISYLSIELKDAIPEKHRSHMGRHVFGCDICQDVCPWNRKAPQSSDASSRCRPGSSAPELAPLMSMTDEEYRRRFSGSPILRAKRRGLLRNVAVALGNAADPEGIPALTLGLRDSEALVRRHAAWALGAIGGGDAWDALEHALEGESDIDVRSEIARALSRSAPSLAKPSGTPEPGSSPKQGSRSRSRSQRWAGHR